MKDRLNERVLKNGKEIENKRYREE